MEAANAEWLNAYNTMNGHALGALYLKDAILLPPHNEAVMGAAKIEQFWTDQIKGGAFKNHTWTILAAAAQSSRYRTFGGSLRSAGQPRMLPW
jgi:ketosteroid isomerase-like protein